MLANVFAPRVASVFVPLGNVTVDAAVNFSVWLVFPTSSVMLRAAVSAEALVAVRVTSKAALVSRSARPVSPARVPPVMAMELADCVAMVPRPRFVRLVAALATSERLFAASMSPELTLDGWMMIPVMIVRLGFRSR